MTIVYWCSRQGGEWQHGRTFKPRDSVTPESEYLCNECYWIVPGTV